MKKVKKYASIATAVLCVFGTSNICMPSAEIVEKVKSEEMAYGEFIKCMIVDEENDGTNDFVIITDCDESATEIVLPPQIEGLPVTEISRKAFENCSSLQSISLPDSITKIDSSAFIGCSSLTAIEIPDSVTTLGSCAFEECTSLTDVKLSNSLTEISSQTFRRCESLKSIDIPESVTVFKAQAFAASKLEEITGGENIQFIYGRAFEHIPFFNNQPEVKYFRNWLIGCDPTATVIEVKEGTVAIADNALRRADRLTDISIPDSVTYISPIAFDLDIHFFNNQVGIKYADKWIIGCDEDVTNVEIKEGTRAILEKAFSSCTLLESITIPDSIVSIGDKAFYECSGLKDVTLSNSITALPYGMFSNCSSLESINIHDKITSIGTYCFSNCDSLTNIVLPDSLTELGKYCFLGCDGFTSITLPNSITEIPVSCFASCKNLVDITFPDNLTSIGNCAFEKCNSLIEITIPETVEYIGENVFALCKNLENVYVDENNSNYISVDGVLFDKDKTQILCYPTNSKITEYTVPDTIKNIPYYTFYECANIESIVLPESVESIEIFYCCPKLRSITFENPDCYIPPDCSRIINECISVGNPYGWDIASFEYYFYGTIYGHENSTAQKYAKDWDCKFALIGETPESVVEVVVPEGAVATMYGDINLDNSVNIADIIAINMLILNPSANSASDTAIANADCSRNGSINTADTSLLMNYISMMITYNELA